MGHSRGGMDSDDSGRYPISQRVSLFSSKVPTIQGGPRELAGVPTLSARLWRLYVFVGIFLPGVYALRSRAEIRKLQHLNSDDSVRCDALFQTLAGGTRFNPCRGIARRACVRNPFIYLRCSNSLVRGNDDGYSGSSLPTPLGVTFRYRSPTFHKSLPGHQFVKHGLEEFISDSTYAVPTSYE